MRNVIKTVRAPSAIGPYSQAIEANGFLFISGQIGLVPETMEMIGPDVEQQAKQTLENMKAIIEAGGSKLDLVVKTTVLLRTMDDFAKVNAIYSQYFPSNPPARACYAVAGLPKNALVEIESVAVLPSQTKL